MPLPDTGGAMIEDFVPCDACGHRSYVFAELRSGLELTYCAHHGLEYVPALIAGGAKVLDFSYMVGS